MAHLYRAGKVELVSETGHCCSAGTNIKSTGPGDAAFSLALPTLGRSRPAPKGKYGEGNCMGRYRYGSIGRY